MDALFNDIVRLLYYICDKTGLSYEEINILIYCLLVPASWYLIVWLRRKKGVLLFWVHLLLPVLYYVERQKCTTFSERFYNSNIAALEYLGKMYKTGYVGISLLIGIAAPVLLYALLLFAPKRFLLWVYGSFIGLNMLYYVWVLNRF